MRPVSLTLEGFTSFASRTHIPFQELDLFAITGQTGAGKSSILDGILFALFGRTPRGVSVPELRTMGSASLKVQLEFAAGDARYLVSRVYQGKSAVAFTLSEGSSGNWKLITNQVKQGDDAIEQILGLDFDGFTRAVILPQGAFDQFLRGETKQRTKILSDLLGLHIYQAMMQAANSRASERKTRVDLLKKQLEQDFAGVNAQAQLDLEERIDSLHLDLKENAERLEKLQQLRTLAAELRQTRKRAGDVARELEQARRNREAQQQASAHVTRAVEDSARRKASAEQQLAQSGFDEAAYAQLLEATPVARAVEDLRKELAAKRALLRELPASSLTMSYAEARQRYGPPELVAKLAAELKAAHIPDADARQKELEAAAEHAEHVLERLRVSDLRAQLRAGDRCPVCEQVVTAPPNCETNPTAERARKDRDATRSALEQFRLARKTLSTLEEKAAALHDGPLDELAAALRNLEARSRAEEELEALSAKLRSQNAELQKHPEWSAFPVEELEENLKTQRALRDRRLALQKESQQATDAHIQALQQATAVQAALLQLERNIAEKEREVADLETRAAAAAAQLAPQLESLPPILHGDECDRVERAAKALQDESSRLRQSLGQTESRLEQVKRGLQRIQEITAQAEAAAAEARRYQQLGTLLNARNFIAYVQRQMLQRLAALASEELRTLSEGRYTLTLSADSNEFYVEDHWNARAPRSAKTLSGGESFLASLSLALALSDSIAGFGRQKRLDSLFLDEGFSTLDPDSLQTAIEAIQRLADSRRMVGVISHLPQLAEQLSSRIEVKKSSSGSTVEIVHGNHSHSIVAGGL